MSRAIVRLHTIEDWLQADPITRTTVLGNIRLKDRLEAWLRQKFFRHQANPPMETVYRHCLDCDGTGQAPTHPRLPGLHPSQVGHSCMRRIYYQMEGTREQEPFDFRGELIFGLGSAVHRIFQRFGQQGAWGPCCS